MRVDILQVISELEEMAKLGKMFFMPMTPQHKIIEYNISKQAI
jgi:hypothetical protein